MYKRIFLIILTQLNFFNNYSQQNIRVDSAKFHQQSNLQKASEEIESKQDALLEQRLKQASETIQNQSISLELYNKSLTIIGIYLTILSLAAPFAIYFFGIKPWRKAMKDLEKTLSSRITEYLNKNTEVQIENSIDVVVKDFGEKSNAIIFLQTIGIDKIKGEQLFRIYSYLNSLPFDYNYPTIIERLTPILGAKENGFADLYFEKIIVNISDERLRKMAYNYFSLNNLNKLLQHLRKYLITVPSNSKLQLLLNDIRFICEGVNLNTNIKVRTILSIYNDAQIVKLFESQETSRLKEQARDYVSELSIKFNDLENTYLFKS